jgi:hypothetical protein
MRLFLEEYFKAIVALVVALVVLFFLLNLAGKKLPGIAGTTAEKLGAAASGQMYHFAG